MTPKEIQLNKMLKGSGYSATKQRLYIFILLIGKEPMTIAEIIKKSDSKIDRASVYRIITLFDQIGITQRLNIGWKYRIELTDKFAEHHHHLTCLNCQNVIPINQHKLEIFIDQLASDQSFKPIEHQLEIQGLCKNCQKL